MHLSGVYRSNALSYIELTMQEISKPFTRSIPRPRYRPKAHPQPPDVKRLKVTQQLMPRLKPIKLEPAEKELPDSLVEGISMPDIPAVSGLNIADWGSGDLMGEYSTPGSYLEMVRFRIERCKKYPQIARVRNIEGCVTIRFVITPEGGVRGVEVAKRSGNKALDQAALKAVKDAAPFPKPPDHLFKRGVPLELTIVFELT
ncbi:MAG: energy transducer TonB [Desulfobacterales bacterium]|uniref:Energy transducer TonB n=1 Tax=Candidatus Desulfatibia profunda TaxID=2841695 RepID=A0A8J6NR85_9BACT|nr:energy transducer TonB [Candidatus Desulfatibia profunda]MBL7179074.1 energy transducer TonB [Desulfobacterales bacterium]